MTRFVCFLFLIFSFPCFSQVPVSNISKDALHWADSVLQSLSQEERIAQLMVVRLSSIDQKTRKPVFYDSYVSDLIKKYNIGGICLFQGSPVKQAETINTLQQLAKTPILVCIDAEWGLGMRMTDSVLPLPKQMMLGAMKDESIVYQYGKVVARQCLRTGIQVNYAPVVDVNNNPSNPVINDRSFGENKYTVARFGIQYMKGMQDMGVMACAKHFPGHGDVAVDSHYDLPVINKSLAELDSLELYPFRQIINAGVDAAMVAHLYIPSIDAEKNRATSLSKNNVDILLRKKLGFTGITFTDALEMQAVKKFYPNGASAVESLIAGNDMLCLPEDVPVAITKIQEAIRQNKLSNEEIDNHCRKVLIAKYQYGMHNLNPVNTNNITADLNRDIPALTKLVAENAITLLAKEDKDFFPLHASADTINGDIMYVGFGINTDNTFSSLLRKELHADVQFMPLNNSDAAAEDLLLDKLADGNKKLVIGLHNLSRSAAGNYGLDIRTIRLINKIQQKNHCIIFLFGNAYAASNFCNAPNLVLCYEDAPEIQSTAFSMLKGRLSYKGALPVTVCEKFPSGYGLTTKTGLPFYITPNHAGFSQDMPAKLDSIVNAGISQKAYPGCVVLLAKNGKIAYQKAYGHFSYNDSTLVKENTVYDLASLTKICASTLAVMRLYESGKIDLKKKLADYLPEVKGTNKENISIEKMLLHQAGLLSYIPYYKETLDAAGNPLVLLYRKTFSDSFSIRITDSLYMRKDQQDVFYKKIITSPLGQKDTYVYSDNDFIFLGKIVEAITGSNLDEYVRRHFYNPMSLESAGYLPRKRIPLSRIAPTEEEKIFRQQLIKADVHDHGAAIMGGIAGHAGVFSDAYDLACIMQMLLNGGVFNGKVYLQKETIDLFTGYQSKSSRRGYGFDKPEKDNASRLDPYPALSASPMAFGHSGYTGTWAWADPKHDLVFIFLCNRLNPEGGTNSKLQHMNLRSNLLETVYKSMEMKK